MCATRSARRLRVSHRCRTMLIVTAVTLDGTVIHKSGLITGGRGQGARKFNDRETDNLNQMKDKLVQQLSELNKSKPKDKADEQNIHHLSRLEAESATAKDDLVSTVIYIC